MDTNLKSIKIDIPVIDHQHEALVELVHRVTALTQIGDVELNTLKKELNNVLNYAIDHFDSEEYFMRSINYPYYEEHVLKHDGFRTRMDDFFSRLNKKDTTVDALITRLSTWLEDWLDNHLQTEDKKLADFIKETSALSTHPKT